MTTKWSGKKNGVRVGVSYTAPTATVGATTAQVGSPKVLIDRDVNIVDTANKLVVSGGAITDVTQNNLNCSGTGQKTIYTATPTARTLEGLPHKVNFKAVLSAIDYAGATLEVTDSITYPPYIPSPVGSGASQLKAANGNDGSGGMYFEVSSGLIVLYNTPCYESAGPLPETLEIQRQADTTSGTWTHIADCNSYFNSDNPPAGHKYRYRVCRRNKTTGARGPWLTFGWITK